MKFAREKFYQRNEWVQCAKSDKRESSLDLLRIIKIGQLLFLDLRGNTATNCQYIVVIYGYSLVHICDKVRKKRVFKLKEVGLMVKINKWSFTLIKLVQKHTYHSPLFVPSIPTPPQTDANLQERVNWDPLTHWHSNGLANWMTA